ncbi:hypothetical protein FHG87_005638 [Trinorchestia longiramus]|nr:hypothetical protein FHG87_005638 [Trinorchestia longiramus]
MQMSFQKLCIRPEPGFAYDKGSMVQLIEGGSFSEMLVKITSKCDTSLMLLSSYKGPIKNFAIKVIGLKSRSASSSVTSTVLSGFKKGLSFLNGNSEAPLVSEEEQITEAWQDIEAQGYHGMQVLTLIDSGMLPDNECRELYNLWQFVIITLQSINAYYMFQKPARAFQYDADYSFNQLMQAYPAADTFALAVLWQFENSGRPGSIRATPIIRSSAFSDTTSSPFTSPVHSRTPRFTKREQLSKLPHHSITTTTTSTTTKRKMSEPFNSSSIWERKSTPVQSRHAAPLGRVEQEEQDDDDENDEDENGDDEENEDEFESFSSHEASFSPGPTKRRVTSPIDVVAPPNSSVARKQKPASPVALPRAADKVRTPKAAEPKRNKEPEPVIEVPVLTTKRTSRKKAVVAVAEESELPLETPSAQKVKGTPKRVAVRKQASRRGRSQPEPADDSMETEVAIRPPIAATAEQQEETMDTDEVQASGLAGSIDPNSITFSFDEPVAGAPKPRGGRRSMVASARKSLASEWPQADQEHMLHFFDNLNPQHSETSRVALTCKYALIQYDRDLSSKLLYQWLERKGRAVQLEVTDFNLAEADQKGTVLRLFNSLSDVQNEATRVSFVLKFMQTQYGVTVSSKQLYTWLKEKPKKGKK